MILSVQNSNFMFCRIFVWSSTKSRTRNSLRSVFGPKSNIVWHMVEVVRRDFMDIMQCKYPRQWANLEKCKRWRKWLSMSEWTTTNFLTLDMRLNHSTVSSFLGKRDLWTTQLPSKRLRGSLSQELQSANHQLTTCDAGKTSFALHWEHAKFEKSAARQLFDL